MGIRLLSVMDKLLTLTAPVFCPLLFFFDLAVAGATTL